jgi:hypothetical protein
VVLSQDGSLQMLDGSGKSAWQVRVPGSGGEDWKLDVSPDGKLVAIGASHHAVGIDGNSGQTLFDVPFRFKEPGKSGTPVCAVAFIAALPDGSGAAAGSNTGRVMLIDTKGATRWKLGGVTEESYAKYLADLKEWEAGAPQRATENDAFKKAQEAFKVANAEWEKDKKKSEKPVPPVALKQAPKPQAPKPIVYTQGAFTNDGKALLALSDTEAHLIDATTGELKSKEGGVSGKVAPVRAGDNFIITNYSGRVALYSPADGKSLKQMTIQVPYFDHNTGKPKPPVGSGIAAMAPTEDGGVLIGSENESTIRFLKSPEGDVKAQTTWKLEDTRRLIKRISVKGNLAVLGYWGGHLQIIDTANGDIKAEQDLPQDIAALNWQNNRVLIALADGRVQAYDVK